MLTKYDRAGASSRVRLMDWVGPLEAHGFRFDVRPLLSDIYVRDLYAGRRADRIDLALSFARRVRDVLAMNAHDLVWVEKELFPWMPGLDALTMTLTRSPIVIDIDDAVFHYYDLNRHALVRRLLGRKIDHVFARATLVLAGNSYLAHRAARAGAHWIELMPTVVETARYTPRIWAPTMSSAMRVGWIGSPATEAYLKLVEGPLNDLAATTSGKTVLIGARAERDDALRATVLPWSTATEVADLQSLDVGVMPLPDEPFERGKCGFKLIQYMACALPVIASPVGVNVDIVEHGVTGFLATTDAEWRDALARLSAEPELRVRMGRAGRARFERDFSREALTPRLAELLSRAARRT